MEKDYFSDPYVQTMMNNMPDKTGKSWEEWQQVLKTEGLEKYGEIMALLKGQFGLTHGFANTITLLYRQMLAGGPPTDSELVNAQYAKKQNMKPWFDQLIKAVKEFGSDIEIAPKKNYVSLRRATQFGIIQPSTQSRMDLGVNLKDVQASGCLIEGDKWSGMCSHRIEVHGEEDITSEVIDWLRKAYDQAV